MLPTCRDLGTPCCAVSTEAKHIEGKIALARGQPDLFMILPKQVDNGQMARQVKGAP